MGGTYFIGRQGRAFAGPIHKALESAGELWPGNYGMKIWRMDLWLTSSLQF